MSTLRPPQTLHENFVTRHMARDPVTGEHLADPVLSSLARSVREARSRADKAIEIAATIDSNSVAGPATKAQHKREHLPRIGDRAAEILEAALETARSELALVEKSLALKSPADQTQAGIHAELRALLRGLKPEARVAAINDAIEANDVTIIAAVAGAPPLLSGLTADRVAMFVDRAQRKANPELAARRDQVAAAIKSAELGNIALTAFRQTLTPPDPKTAIAVERAAAALVQAKALGE